MVRVTRFDDSAAVAKGAANEFVAHLKKVLADKPETHILLTGGTVGIATLAAIAETAEASSIDWQRVHFWWGDERFVEAASEDRNANQARKALLEKINLDPAKVHEFPASDNLSLAEALAKFSSQVEAVKPVFDIAFLGIGPDGHVASLFPEKPEIPAGEWVMAESNSPKPPPQRLSFTYEALNSAREIWFVVAGSDKAKAVEVAFSDHPERLPVGRVHGQDETRWFLDNAAGSLVWSN